MIFTDDKGQTFRFEQDGLNVWRSSFDKWLADKAAESGAEVRDCTSAISCEEKEGLVTVAYHAVASNYQKVIRRMTALNHNRVLLGLTATPKRMQDPEQRKLQKMFNVDANLLKNKGMNGFVYKVTMAQRLPRKSYSRKS